MNAKELKEMVFNCLKDQDGGNYPEGSIGYMRMQYKSDLLDRYSAQLCAEQRRICMMRSHHSTENDVDNAPMPEL